MRIYFVKTNACNEIAYVNGDRVKFNNYAPSGMLDESVDLYSDNVIEELKDYFSTHIINNYEELLGDEAQFKERDFDNWILVYQD